VLELATERASARVALDQDRDAVGHVDVVDHRRRVVEPALDARPPVRAEVDVDVRNPERVGRVDLLLHRVERLLAEPLPWVYRG